MYLGPPFRTRSICQERCLRAALLDPLQCSVNGASCWREAKRLQLLSTGIGRHGANAVPAPMRPLRVEIRSLRGRRRACSSAFVASEKISGASPSCLSLRSRRRGLPTPAAPLLLSPGDRNTLTKMDTEAKRAGSRGDPHHATALRLVGGGVTNSRLAAALGVSRPTGVKWRVRSDTSLPNTRRQATAKRNRTHGPENTQEPPCCLCRINPKRS